MTLERRVIGETPDSNRIASKRKEREKVAMREGPNGEAASGVGHLLPRLEASLLLAPW
jgi:hypothetical protein